MMSASPQDPLLPMLEAAEQELSEHLKEACTRQAVKEESTGELMRLEEALSEAASAAKQAISIRRRMRTRGEGSRSRAAAPERRGADSPASPSSAAPEEASMRELTDSTGRRWRVWAVSRAQMSRRAGAEAYMGEYKEGWLAFESVAGDERRRLPHYPEVWQELSDAELERLLAKAEVARGRKTTPPEGQQSAEKHDA